MTVKCDIEIMQNRSKGSLCPILQIHKWYLIIFYDTYIHPFFSSQILQIPNFPDTKQATTAANEWQVCSRSRPCTQQPKGCNDQKVSQKTACQWKKKRLTQFPWEDSTLAMVMRKRMTKHCANPCQPRMSEENFMNLSRSPICYNWLIGGNLWSPPLNQSQVTHGCRDKICENFNSNILAKPQRIVSLL